MRSIGRLQVSVACMLFVVVTATTPVAAQVDGRDIGSLDWHVVGWKVVNGLQLVSAQTGRQLMNVSPPPDRAFLMVVAQATVQGGHVYLSRVDFSCELPVDDGGETWRVPPYTLHVTEDTEEARELMNGRGWQCDEETESYESVACGADVSGPKLFVVLMFDTWARSQPDPSWHLRVSRDAGPFPAQEIGP